MGMGMGRGTPQRIIHFRQVPIRSLVFATFFPSWKSLEVGSACGRRHKRTFFKVHVVTNHFTHARLCNQNACHDGNVSSYDFVGTFVVVAWCFCFHFISDNNIVSIVTSLQTMRSATEWNRKFVIKRNRGTGQRARGQDTILWICSLFLFRNLFYGEMAGAVGSECETVSGGLVRFAYTVRALREHQSDFLVCLWRFPV